jgi:hypothetical protein
VQRSSWTPPACAQDNMMRRATEWHGCACTAASLPEELAMFAGGDGDVMDLHLHKRCSPSLRVTYTRDAERGVHRMMTDVRQKHL